MAILARSGMTGGAELCPHPGPRQSCAILIQGGRRGFVACPECKSMLESLIAGWHDHATSARMVRAEMHAHGYSRGDALRLLGQLLWDRVQLRLGLIREEQL